jgi:carboxylate-amine ligase
MDSFGEYERAVAALTDLGVIEDSSKIWWDLRPSSRFPTIESRICDVQPRLEHTLTLAALTQALTRMLSRLATNNQRWRIYDNFLLSENRWRAQRYATREGLIDFGRHEIVPMSELVTEMLGLVEEDAAFFSSTEEVERSREILNTGTSSVRQRQAYQDAISNGQDENQALQAVVHHLIEEFHADL